VRAQCDILYCTVLHCTVLQNREKKGKEGRKGRKERKEGKNKFIYVFFKIFLFIYLLRDLCIYFILLCMYYNNVTVVLFFLFCVGFF
jgi:hypothetical protein